MQYLYSQAPQNPFNYELISVPTELVPVVKSLIDTHNTKIINSLMPSNPTYGYQQLMPPMPPPPTSNFGILSKPEEKNINIVKSSKRRHTDTNHSICTEWIKSDCKTIGCELDHYVYPGFKTENCRHWVMNKCRYDTIKCRNAHGTSDPYNRLRKEELYYVDNKRGRSRSRERH
jgi:hypothetical protein